MVGVLVVGQVVSLAGAALFLALRGGSTDRTGLLLIGTAAYGVATTKGLVSIVSVIATLSPVVTVALAVVLLHERLAGRQRLGVTIALAGVVLLAAG